MSNDKIDTSGVLINSQEEINKSKISENEKEIDEIMKEIEKLFEEINWDDLNGYYEKKND